MSKELDGRIALALGWRSIKPALSRADSLTGLPPEGIRTFVPRWSSDLNLMWELENRLDEKEVDVYCRCLTPLFCTSCMWQGTHATAEQKAEAYLKVKEGK